MAKRKKLSTLSKAVPKENHGKRLKQVFHGGPWDGKDISAWPSQIHQEEGLGLPGGVYVRAETIDTATERHYRWVEA